MTSPEKTELTTTEARQGVTPHMTRNVLRWGIPGAIAALFVAWLFYDYLA
jgi:hypothetical protein